MSLELRKRLFAELDRLVLVDPHTHINPLDPGSHTLADILGYHYYTELAHSAGMPKAQIEEPGLNPKEKVRRLIENLGPIQNTIQYSWLVEMCQAFFGLTDDHLSLANWEPVYDGAEQLMSHSDWPQQVLAKSRLESVFLTNDFDDPLEGFDTNVYIPCLRNDDLVFHLAKPEVRQRLERATGIAPTDARFLRRGIAALFQHFKARGARACAISLPPDFSPMKVSPARANTALAAILADGPAAAESHRRAIGNYVFWTLAEMCDAFKLPFDLMIGVNRGVYEAGVHQGRDLYDSRVSLIQYKELFNAFPRVTFPISVLASVTNQELTSYAWIFPNVVTNGHWWYSNTPAFIEHDLAARLEAVPRTKQIGYYSDMYKLEFALPKFAMFKRILAKVLAERFVIDRGWTETHAVALGTQVLRGNVESIFRWNENLREELPDENALEPLSTNSPLGPIPAAVALETMTITPVSGETEIPEKLPDPPAKQFIRPVPEEGMGEELHLEGTSRVVDDTESSEQPPELEVIDHGSDPVHAESEDAGGGDGSEPPAEQSLGAEDAGESVRQTEPIAVKPAPEKPSQADDQWDFLRKDR
jgi:glucuronate isomerase